MATTSYSLSSGSTDIDTSDTEIHVSFDEEQLFALKAPGGGDRGSCPSPCPKVRQLQNKPQLSFFLAPGSQGLTHVFANLGDDGTDAVELFPFT